MVEPVNILLVDDQPAKLLSYRAILEYLGENLISAGSAREAFEYLLKNDVAIILIDVIMPELDGFELAAMIRNHPRFERTAIIFVSALALTDVDLLKGYEHGAVDYLLVPVVPKLLRAKVRVFAELYRKTRELAVLNQELERRVAERTAELAQANALLEQRVEERTRERELALAQVHEMQKMESLGQLTGGVAHDFNNLLMAVLGNLELLRKRLPDDARLLGLVDGAMQGADRGATLTKRMLAFARRQELRPETVDLRRLVDGMEEMLRRTLGPTIQIATEYRPDLPPIRVDPSQLELALLNLALNARDAMPHGGRLVIGGYCAASGPDGPSGLRVGRYVCLFVSDTGDGIDEATLKRAAEPFFTTKGSGKGTGLGLSMVDGVAAQSGGAMRMTSRQGVGTTVEIWLPVGEVAAMAESSRPGVLFDDAAIPRRVLVVDDDPLIASSTAAMLEDLGHVVIEAPSGARALDMLRLGAKGDVVVTDLPMPALTGKRTGRQIRQHWPSLPIILATGYAELPNGEDPGLPRLAKPYLQSELAAQIAKALAGTAGNVIPLDSARRA